MVRSCRLSGCSRSPMKVMAALLMSMSSPPKSSTVRATMMTTSASWARLVGTPTASPPMRSPAALARSTVSSRVPGVRWGASLVERAAQATRQPSAANATATAAPTPRLAPVTRAIFPWRSIPGVWPFLCGRSQPGSRRSDEAVQTKLSTLLAERRSFGMVSKDGSSPRRRALRTRRAEIAPCLYRTRALNQSRF